MTPDPQKGPRRWMPVCQIPRSRGCGAKSGKSLRCHTGQGPSSIFTPVQNRNRDQRKDSMPTMPMRYLHHIVGAHQPDKAGEGESGGQDTQCIGGKAGREAFFQAADSDLWVAGHTLCLFHPVWQRSRVSAAFQGILWRYQPPNLVQIQPTDGFQADMAVSIMGRVKGPPQNSDPSLAPVATAWYGAGKG